MQVTAVPCTRQGALDPRDVEDAIRPNTTLIVLNHASNVVGTLLPISEVGEIARRYDLLFLVDAAQTAGAYPIDMLSMAIDLLAFTGHKALGGPMGTGGLCLGERVAVAHLAPLKRGGTGSRSESEEQPGILPDIYESGTANAVGLAGLGAAVRVLLERGIAPIRTHEIALTQRLLAGLGAIEGGDGLWPARRHPANRYRLVHGRRPAAFRCGLAPG